MGMAATRKAHNPPAHPLSYPFALFRPHSFTFTSLGLPTATLRPLVAYRYSYSYLIIILTTCTHNNTHPHAGTQMGMAATRQAFASPQPRPAPPGPPTRPTTYYYSTLLLPHVVCLTLNSSPFICLYPPPPTMQPHGRNSRLKLWCYHQVLMEKQ
jgi:hypothetical protein